MRKLIQSAFSFSWTLALLGSRSLARLLLLRRRDERARTELDAVAEAAGGRLDGALGALYTAGEKLQGRVVDGLCAAWGPHEGDAARPLAPAWDPSTFVALGDGLAAGMGHFRLEGSAQASSFPVFMARAMGVPFAVPRFQAPGLGDVIGLEEVPPIVPDIRQSTVLESLPAAAAWGNLSVPGLTLAEALERRPIPPLVDRDSNRQTLINFILGLPELSRDPRPGPTQVERAAKRRPTLALVCLGYDEVLRAAVAGDAGALPAAAAFQANLERLFGALDGTPTVAVTTIPDPLRSAYFSRPETAATILKTTPDFLHRHYGVGPDDLVHLRGLYAIGHQMMARQVGPLARSPVLAGPVAGALRAALAALNDAVRAAAAAAGARVLDLHGLLVEVADSGVEVGDRRLHASYLGGLYRLNGAYPGATLNAHIANWAVAALSEGTASAYPEVPVAAVAREDADTRTELAPGPPATDAFTRPRRADEIPAIRPLPPAVGEVPIQTTYPHLQPGKQGCTPAIGIPAGGMADPSDRDPGFEPLHVPAKGLSYCLEINPTASYFGDALRAVDCPGEPPLVPGLPPFGLCENVFFGGFLLTTSPLRGKVEIRISPPDAARVCRFEIRHPGGLEGEDADLVGPQLFRMPVQHTRIRDVPGLVSSGELHLDTGRVTNFHYNVQNMNTALDALLRLNPGVALPALGAALLTYPGLPNAGSSWAEFTPRPDGKLDISFAAHMFVPFGDDAGGRPVRFALPFCTPDLEAASFVARGTSLHPRIFVTTRATPAAPSARRPEIPFNTVRELTALGHDTCFGDAFGLNSPALGGSATGRTQLLSRVRVQFGARTGDTVPVAIQILPPGGLLSGAPTPPPFLPPGLSRGAIGFDTVMRFPNATYPQSGLASPDDPFNLCATSVSLSTGETVSPLLWRGYVVQALFADLLRVEPCTPADSFNYQGPARFEAGADGELVLRWLGQVYLPYPEGFRFPAPPGDTAPALVIGPGSRLDPFRIVHATGARARPYRGPIQGEATGVTSPSTGQRFSYRYRLSGDPARQGETMFEYVDHATGARFRLTTLAWIDVAKAPGGAAPADGLDVVTFGGFGAWSADPTDAVHQVSVQIATTPDASYVGILVDGGVTANVDTKPAKIALSGRP